MEPEKKLNGSFVGLAIIIIILIIGGIYIWQSNQKNAEKIKKMTAQPETITNQDSAALDALEQNVTTTDTNIDVDANTVN